MNLNPDLELTYQIPTQDYKYVLDYMFKGCLANRYDHIISEAGVYSYIDEVEHSIIRCLEAGVPEHYVCITRKRVELDMLWHRLSELRTEAIIKKLDEKFEL